MDLQYYSMLKNSQDYNFSSFIVARLSSVVSVIIVGSLLIC